MDYRLLHLADKDVNVTSIGLSLPVLEYETLVLRQDMEVTAELLPSIPEDQIDKMARFLEGHGHRGLALEVATDPEHK
jgi:coatomer subunit beta'